MLISKDTVKCKEEEGVTCFIQHLAEYFFNKYLLDEQISHPLINSREREHIPTKYFHKNVLTLYSE